MSFQPPLSAFKRVKVCSCVLWEQAVVVSELFVFVVGSSPLKFYLFSTYPTLHNI
jgi:hypothetical protein